MSSLASYIHPVRRAFVNYASVAGKNIAIDQLSADRAIQNKEIEPRETHKIWVWTRYNPDSSLNMDSLTVLKGGYDDQLPITSKEIREMLTEFSDSQAKDSEFVGKVS